MIRDALLISELYNIHKKGKDKISFFLFIEEATLIMKNDVSQPLFLSQEIPELYFQYSFSLA